MLPLLCKTSSAFGFDTSEKPFASGGAALPSGRKLLFGEAISQECDTQRRRSQEESKKCVRATLGSERVRHREGMILTAGIFRQLA